MTDKTIRLSPQFIIKTAKIETLAKKCFKPKNFNSKQIIKEKIIHDKNHIKSNPDYYESKAGVHKLLMTTSTPSNGALVPYYVWLTKWLATG